MCLEGLVPEGKQLCQRCADTCNRIRHVDSSPHAIAVWVARRARRFERTRVRQRDACTCKGEGVCDACLGCCTACHGDALAGCKACSNTGRRSDQKRVQGC